MRSTRLSFWSSRRSVSSTILLLLLTLFSTVAIVRAAEGEEDEPDDYDVKARVVRISLLTGEVRLKRNGNKEWERAQVNTALVEGDAVSTDHDARLELQIGARNFVRLGADTMVRVVTLRDEGIALSVVEGTASVRLAKFDREHEYFEIDAPKTTLAAERNGLYRVDVSREGRVRVSARDGGHARIYSETSGFALRDGRTAELIVEGTDAGDWEFVAGNTADSWDDWVNQRERYLADRLRYDVQYYDNDIWGAEDLYAYGDWTYTKDYGWVWRPHASVVSAYADWTPYRYGTWVWIAPYGWTWVGQEPWGWAPYHYGRWVYYNNYWAWSPRGRYYRHSWWRPALVAFYISFGDNVCWYPLDYHQHDPHSRHHRRGDRDRDHDRDHDRLRPTRSEDLARMQRVNPAYHRAVSTVATRDFGTGGARPHAADEALARRVVNAEPLESELPIRPIYAAGERTTTGNHTERLTVVRPARVIPPVESIDRPTGAATRSPGVPLDSELRRTRILNGREGIAGRPVAPIPNSTGSDPEARPTGVLARPPRVQREDIPARTDLPRSDDNVTQPTQPIERPERSDTRDRAPVRTPPTPNDNGSSGERPARPERSERPIRDRSDQPDQPTRREASEPVERPQRHEAPAPRQYEPPVRNDPPPRNDPPVRYDPPARNDPPPRSDPPPRNDPPARSEPPPRSDPPPSRSEPPPARSEPPPQPSESRQEHVPAKVRDPLN